MKRALVTGAAGFIGSALARSLASKGVEVWTIDNLTTGFRENVPEGVHLIEGNCQDPSVIARLGETRFDAILHIAGQSSGEISFDDPSYDLGTNAESTLLLVRHALRTGCRRFVYASTMSVYGEVPDEPTREDFPCKPLSFYGVGKLASEHYLRIYGARGLEWTALRLFNVYGPNQNMANLRQGMVSIFLAQMLKQGRVIVKGAPDRFRDFIYIDDVVRITESLLANPASHGKIVNVATGVKTTVGALLESLRRHVGLDREIVFEKGTPGDQRGVYADLTLLRSLGGNPRVSLEEGLARMVEWAKKASW